MTNLKQRFKNSLISKINNLKYENKMLRNKLNELDVTKYIDELNLKQSKIRELTLKNKELERKLKKYEIERN